MALNLQRQDDNTDKGFQRWYWLLVPAAAILAYLLVLRVDFLGDDLWLLQTARDGGVGWRLFVPSSDWLFYRPVGSLITWHLGWLAWGYNPLPYHLIGLLAHGATALMLGLFAAEVSRNRWLGWIAGLLFGVFPLHSEAVGWLASQWDIWATLFGITSLWLFVRWWRAAGEGRTTPEMSRRLASFVLRPASLYWLAVLSYALGLFSKESLLTFVPLYVVAAWAATPEVRWADGRVWRRMALALVPFAVVLVLNVAIRLVNWGALGGYSSARPGIQDNFFGWLIEWVRVLLAPVNATLLGNQVAQIVGVAAALAILLGLISYGREQRRMLYLSGAWLVLTLAPVLNLGVGIYNLESNRFLYLPTAGFCLGLAALIYSAVRAWGRYGRVASVSARSALVALLVLCGVVSWIHMGSVVKASDEIVRIDTELARLIPPPAEPRPNGMVWYVENPPHYKQGVDFFNLAFGFRRYFIANNDVPNIEVVENAEEAPLDSGARDAYAIRFRDVEPTGDGVPPPTQYFIDKVFGRNGAEVSP
jgi:hypothetical protein